MLSRLFQQVLALALFLAPAICPASPQSHEDAATAFARGEFNSAMAIWDSLATAGDALSQYHLGRMYHFGAGIPKDMPSAAHWYQKAAE